jgi:aryl-alcohol dehydrogenase-like predicted oxidoreductase
VELYQLHNPRLDAIRKDDLWAELEALKQEGKIRMAGVALGPALKPDRQSEEGIVSARERKAAVQIIYNLLEQFLGETIFPVAREEGVPVITRVPHASDILSGIVKEDTVFDKDDHRIHRVPTDEAKRKWQVDGLKKVEKLGFLLRGGERTLGQAAIQFILHEPSIASVLPNIYDEASLTDYARASDTPPLSPEEFEQVQALYAANFHLDQPDRETVAA